MKAGKTFLLVKIEENIMNIIAISGDYINTTAAIYHQELRLTPAARKKPLKDHYISCELILIQCLYIERPELYIYSFHRTRGYAYIVQIATHI